jgi:hypothetical protein
MSRLQNFVWTTRMKTLVDMNWLDLDTGIWCHQVLNSGLRRLIITSHLLVHIHYTLWYSKSYQNFIEVMHLLYGLSRSLMCSFIISWVICEHASTAGYLVSDVNRWWSWFYGDFDRGGVAVFFGRFYVFLHVYNFSTCWSCSVSSFWKRMHHILVNGRWWPCHKLPYCLAFDPKT